MMTRPARPAPHSLMPLVSDPARLKRAARELMRRGGSPGSDGVTWAQYRDGLDARIAALSGRLRDGTWSPGSVRALTIPSWGKTLPLAIPPAEDRIVHRAVRLAAEPVLELTGAYPPWMYGWRPRAGRVEALSAATAHMAAGRTWVADLDVAAATSGATLQDVMSWTARWISDGSFLRLIRLITASLPGALSPGSGLTPMLTNLRLAETDQQLADLPVIRFTDNYTAFCAGRREAGNAAEQITAALAAAGLPRP
jgi:RNA-directed DNA polymerase